MGFFARLIGREDRADAVTTAGTVSFSDDLLQALLGSAAASREIALQVPTVAGGIDLIANIIAGTPLKLYRDRDGQAEEVPDDPRVRLLNDDTGDTLDANQFWHAMIRDYYLGKGAYAYIRRRGREWRSIHYVDERQIAIERNADPIVKDYSILVSGQRYWPFQFVKILRNTQDGAEGIPITVENPKLIETAYQSLLYELQLVKKGGNKRGFIKAERRLDDASMRALREAFVRMYSNDSENVVILNNGLDFKESSNTSVEMQLNESKITNAREFAKLFHVSPDVMAGRATGDDIASLARLAAIPLMTAIQCALNRDFLLEDEKPSMYWAFDTKELLKGDMKTRFDAYKTALDANFMQVDEVRYAEDLAPLGLTWIRLGLQDVLYDPKTGVIYTPNTNQVSTMSQSTLPQGGGPQEDQNAD